MHRQVSFTAGFGATAWSAGCLATALGRDEGGATELEPRARNRVRSDIEPVVEAAG